LDVACKAGAAPQKQQLSISSSAKDDFADALEDVVNRKLGGIYDYRIGGGNQWRVSASAVTLVALAHLRHYGRGL
jgi:hypothetical protein